MPYPPVTKNFELSAKNFAIRQFKTMVCCVFVLGAAIASARADVVYHGSPELYKTLVPQPNKRMHGDKIYWSGEGIFATKDRRVALLYTAKRRIASFTFGVDLINQTLETEPVTLYLEGGTSQEEALQKFYGTKDKSVGYIYDLDPSTFTHEQGLGKMEVVSRVNPKFASSPEYPDGVETVNPREELQKYVSEGRMKIEWKADEEPAQLRHSRHLPADFK